MSVNSDNFNAGDTVTLTGVIGKTAAGSKVVFIDDFLIDCSVVHRAPKKGDLVAIAYDNNGSVAKIFDHVNEGFAVVESEWGTFVSLHIARLRRPTLQQIQDHNAMVAAKKVEEKKKKRAELAAYDDEDLAEELAARCKKAKGEVNS